MYNRRNEVGRLFRRLKGYRRIFSPFEKLDAMFLGLPQLRAGGRWASRFVLAGPSLNALWTGTLKILLAFRSRQWANEKLSGKGE